jgi:hypothetical protein
MFGFFNLLDATKSACFNEDGWPKITVNGYRWERQIDECSVRWHNVDTGHIAFQLNEKWYYGNNPDNGPYDSIAELIFNFKQFDEDAPFENTFSEVA